MTEPSSLTNMTDPNMRPAPWADVSTPMMPALPRKNHQACKVSAGTVARAEGT
jgi:hypothetical protein